MVRLKKALQSISELWCSSCPVYFLAALVCIGLGAGAPGIAQDKEVRELRFRGFHFDPLDLQNAGVKGWLNLGITQDLQAAEPRAGVPHWRLLQFSRPLDRDDRNRLNKLGLRLDIYLGGGYVERVTLETVQTLLESGLLRASVPYHPAFKLAPALGRQKELRAKDRFLTKERQAIPGLLLRAVLFPGSDPEVAANQIQKLPGVKAGEVYVQDTRRFGGPAQIVFRVSSEANLAAAARVDAIRSLEEVGEIISDNAKAAKINQSGTSSSGTIWDQGLAGEGQVIGILDDGLPDLNHCFFKDKVLQSRNASGPGESPDHATFVAGNAAGDDYQNPGLHNDRGGAWAAKLVLGNWHDIYEIDVWSEEPYSTLPEELDAASKLAFIHSNSWHEHSRLAGYSARAAQVDDFTWRNEDHLVLGSAGPRGEEWGPPAIAKNALAVSAANDNDPMIFGGGFNAETPSGRRKPDIVAVGCNISSAKAGTSCVTVTRPCRTSYATPHAAAIAALARQYYVEGWYPSGEPRAKDHKTPTGSLLKATLINSAQDMTKEPVVPPGAPEFPSLREGWGVVTLDRTLYFKGSDRGLQVWDIRSSGDEALTTGDQHVYSLAVTDSAHPLKVTLVWADYPGESNASGAEDESEDNNTDLINDLDLEVVTPDGTTTYLGNDFDLATGRSKTGGAADDVNNVEQVLVTAPAVGKWTLRVKAANVPIPGFDQEKKGQGYALVATAALVEPEPVSSLWIAGFIDVAIVIMVLILIAILIRWRKKPGQVRRL